MKNPYQTDPGAFQKGKRASQEEKLVSVRDDSIQPPPSIGANAFQGIFLGPMVGQPSKASEEDVQPGWGKVILRLFLGLCAVLIVVAALLRLAK